MRANVHLEFYTEKFKTAVDHYFLNEAHLQFTALPLDALKACCDDPSRYPVLILHNNVLVGFFVLHGWDGAKTYSDNRNAILLRAYSIDSRHQGNHYASRSLRVLNDFVKNYFPGKDEMVLAVNHANLKAQCLYVRNGFIDTGHRIMGRKGEQLILHKKLKRAAHQCI
ncbi:GNAT family N-acetyltransferase [Virgibacillus siamensis]|uniref:GNAT family N-acetyltransferase n=1 Tax=Virgibacillus siamensis TaxID=480071 RepID=A0ABN1G9P8_9BACI